jgi:tetratricopeptide (TPR) repeat protein
MRARLLLLAVALAAFGGSLFAGFHFDDYAIFSGPLRPPLRDPHLLTRLTFWLNDALGGQDPLGYHAVNLLIHLGAVLLAYECLRRMMPAAAALAGAALFAIHPLQAEAVNSVAARGVMLAALLCFAALLAWLEGNPWLALVAFAAALLADEQCALFPLVLLLLRPQDRSRHQRWAALTMVALAIAAVIRVPKGSYALGLVSFRFLRLMLVPWGFTVAPDVHEPLWVALAVLAALGAEVVWIWRHPGVPAEATWLMAGVLLWIPGFASNPAKDPRAYLAVFALAASAGLLLSRVRRRALAIGVVAMVAAVSVSRTYVWMSDERLWREAMRRAPHQVQPKIELAQYLKAADALELLGRARQQAPYNAEIPAAIGKVLLDEQQYDGALDELSRAVALNPKNALAFNNRGVALAALGQVPAATADFQHALSLAPNLQEARENLQRLAQ